MSPENSQARFERHVLLLMALVQFINIWDFMIVMPLGPDFARDLGIDAGHIGWIAGSYSIAAAVVGLISARFIDRFDRRSVLLFNITGLMVATMSMLLANNLFQLIATRALTGMFGGPAIAASLAVIADVFPEHRRGEAMGKVFGSFSIASVLGVPLGLEIASLFGWRMAFVAVSIVSIVALIAIRQWLPPMRHHLDNAPKHKPEPIFKTLFHTPAMLMALMMTGAGMFASFLIIPNISAHVQQNMGYPRHMLGLLYFFGGAAAFFSMRFTGKQSDRIGYTKTAFFAVIGICITLYIWFYAAYPWMPVLASFTLFMIMMSTRNVTSNALLSRIPKPSERAGFMSINSSMQSLMSGIGATCGTLLLSETPDHHLAGVKSATLLAMAGFAISVLMMAMIEKSIRRRKPIEPVEPAPL